MPGAEQVAHEEGAVALEVKRAVARRVPWRMNHPWPAWDVELVSVRDRLRVVDVRRLERAVSAHVPEEPPHARMTKHRQRASLALPRLLAGPHELVVGGMQEDGHAALVQLPGDAG